MLLKCSYTRNNGCKVRVLSGTASPLELARLWTYLHRHISRDTVVPDDIERLLVNHELNLVGFRDLVRRAAAPNALQRITELVHRRAFAVVGQIFVSRERESCGERTSKRLQTVVSDIRSFSGRYADISIDGIEKQHVVEWLCFRQARKRRVRRLRRSLQIFFDFIREKYNTSIPSRALRDVGPDAPFSAPWSRFHAL
jgi:hypothetical protein